MQGLLEAAQFREKSLEEENKELRCKLGGLGQKLNDYAAETQKLLETEKLLERLRRKFHECRRLKNEWFTTVNKEQISRDVIDNCRKETAELRRCVRRDKSRLETAYSYVSELETQLKNRQMQINELKSQLDDIRELHKEQIEAIQMRYRALVSVCQRQETHILELYQILECRRNSMSLRTGDGSFELSIPQRCVAREIVSYDDSFIEGHSNDSELYLPFLFRENTRQGLTKKSISDSSYVEDIETLADHA
ncbi:unnamed protein product [Soboliphyme baturini]|uniref:Synaptonemal complex protein 1 n=1 Tax=Soboliphyme baturini TaxID=241478 RepID=A0A183IQH2_9BILA|nr:unnamed protein product [Soboliphyme baturini]